MFPNPWITLTIVGITFIGIAIGRYPIIKSNRTTITLIGVAALILFSQIKFDDLSEYLDFDTLILLFSMMILNANLKIAGFFRFASQFMIRWARTPRAFLALEIILMAVLSALFLNDTICLVFTPMLISMMNSLKRNPIPYLIALATAANVGSVATLTGNPQNMIVGITSGISYTMFLINLAPIALLGVGVIWFVLIKMYPYEFSRDDHFSIIEEDQTPIIRDLLLKTVVICSGLLVAFLAGVPIALAAFIAANLLLITRKHQPHLVFAEIDWNLLVFFAALFIVSGSLQTSGLLNFLHLEEIATQLSVWKLSLITGALSNLISNVPAVILLKPLVQVMANPQLGWLTIAAASTLAGNLTLLGSVANLIVAEIADRAHLDLNFWEYTKSGFLITIATLFIAILWLSFGPLLY
jgi:Na+/H+ antiporter NhaD/arsenite permease-like protein